MVYIRRTPGARDDQLLRWNLPDRVFFAAGACHILAFAFLERFPASGAKAVWIKPLEDTPTNHIVILKGDCAFDFHGFSKRMLCSRIFGAALSSAGRNGEVNLLKSSLMP